MPIPDFIPEGEEHLYPQLRDKQGRRRDFIPDEPVTETKPEPTVDTKAKEKKA